MLAPQIHSITYRDNTINIVRCKQNLYSQHDNVKWQLARTRNHEKKNENK